jgi:hypothetical protein
VITLKHAFSTVSDSKVPFLYFLVLLIIIFGNNI